jgi:hypothetical protein
MTPNSTTFISTPTCENRNQHQPAKFRGTRRGPPCKIFTVEQYSTNRSKCHGLCRNSVTSVVSCWSGSRFCVRVRPWRLGGPKGALHNSLRKVKNPPENHAKHGPARELFNESPQRIHNKKLFTWSPAPGPRFAFIRDLAARRNAHLNNLVNSSS